MGAASSSTSVLPAVPAFVYGWGVRPDVTKNTKDLMGLTVMTTSCIVPWSKRPGETYHLDSTWEESGAPMFICVPPASTGSVCNGDSGGAFYLLYVLAILCAWHHEARHRTQTALPSCDQDFT